LTPRFGVGKEVKFVFAHNATSRAWERLTTLTDLPANDLRERYGVASVNPEPTVRFLATHRSQSLLRFQLRQKEISVCVVNDSLPKGRVPKERVFAIEGDADDPSLSERAGGEQGKAGEVIDRVIRWFRDLPRQDPD
jgi:hypothetical protein